jgi:hypothetical protein
MSTDGKINIFINPSLPERRKEKRTSPAPTLIRRGGGKFLYFNDLAEVYAGKSGKSFPLAPVFSFRNLSRVFTKNAAYILRTCAESARTGSVAGQPFSRPATKNAKKQTVYDENFLCR